MKQFVQTPGMRSRRAARNSALVLLAAFLVSLLFGCGGKAATTAESSAPILADDSGMPMLPSPAELPRTASVPPSDGDRVCRGSEWQPLLSRNHVSSSLFQPEFAGAANRSMNDAAYAVYHFPNMADYSGPARIKLGWLDTSDTPQNVYAGLADFSRNKWKWYKLPSNWSVNLPNFDGFTNDDGSSYLAIVSLDNGSFDLDYALLGKDTAPQIFVSSNLNPNPLLNVAPLNVSFDLTQTRAFGGSIVSFDFDWEGDGTYDESGDTDGLGIHQYQAGQYDFTVRAHGADGQTSTSVLSFVIIDPNNDPPVAGFTRDPQTGDGPLTVQFDGSSSSDPDGSITLYEWDFFNDGNYDIISEEPLAEWVFAVAGLNPVTLRVTDNNFSTATVTEEVQVNIGWRTNPVHGDSRTVYRLSMCTTNDGGAGERACIAYHQADAQELRFVRATNTNGSAWGGVVLPVDTQAEHGAGPSMVVLSNGVPMIAYGLAGGGGYALSVVRATSPSGAAWEEPTVVDSGGQIGTRASLQVINSFPCIATFDTQFGFDQTKILYYASQNVNGTAWNDPLTALTPIVGREHDYVVLGQGSTGIFKRPIVAASMTEGFLSYETYVSGAQNIDGTAWEFPTVMDHWMTSATITEVNGRPAMCSYDGNHESTGVRYVRSTDGHGTVWPVQQVISATGNAADMEVVNGLPFIAFQEPQRAAIYAVSALNADGSAWGEPYVIHRGLQESSCHLTMTLVNGLPLISYQFTDSFNYFLNCLSRY